MKYKIDYEDKIEYKGRILYRIVALRDFSDVKAGDRGGYVQSEKNLSQHGDCWIYDEAMAMDSSRVEENAKMYDKTEILINASMRGNSQIHDKAQMLGDTMITHDARMWGEAVIFGNARLYDFAQMFDKSLMRGCAAMYGAASMRDYTEMSETAILADSARLYGRTKVSGAAVLRGNAVIREDSDYIVFKNWWSSGRYFVWTRSNNMYTVGCFYGTGEELIMKAYQDSELSGQEYERIVRYVEDILNPKRAEKKKKISFIKRLLKYLTKK